jgi:hypothetical protein
LQDWDERAAKNAENWASQCTMGHNTNDDRLFGSYADIGQNQASFTEANADSAE